MALVAKNCTRPCLGLPLSCRPSFRHDSMLCCLDVRCDWVLPCSIRPKGSPVTVKSSISLTDDQHSFARTLVDSGRFPSVSAVLQQSIELLREKIEDEAVEQVALAAILGKRRSGPFLSATRMDSRLSRMIAKKRRAYAVRD